MDKPATSYASTPFVMLDICEKRNQFPDWVDAAP